MAQESRVKKSLLNARVNLIFYFLTLILSFFSRKIFLDCLGTSFVGLIGTLQDLLSYLNLAELGIGSAIGYVLYKPIFEQNKVKINEIISVMGYLYRWIGITILVAGIILSFFLPLIFPKVRTGFEVPLIYFGYYSFLISTLIGYFINYRQNLLGADQRNYVVTAYYQSIMLVKIIVQMTLAYYTQNFYLWFLIELTFGIIYSFILNWKINQTYPWLKAEINKGKQLFKEYPEVIKYTKQLFVQKISYAVQYQTIPLLIYSFVSLPMVALYGNYTIITSKISQLVNTFMESTGASIGNLIAEGDKEKIINVFWELISFRYLIGGIITYSIYVLIDQFITLWLGEEYLLPHTVLILICLTVFLNYTRGGVMQFLFGYGLFYDVWAPIAEIIINLSVAIICGKLWGLPGVLLGGIISMILIVFIWKPIFLYWKGFKESPLIYFFNILKLLLCILLPLLIIHIINNDILTIDITNFVSWIIYATICVISYSIICFSLIYSTSKGMRNLTKRFLAIKKK